MELFSKSMLLRSALLLEKLLHPRPPILRLSLSCSSSSKATGVRKTRQRMTSKRTQPAWEAPNPGEIPKLKLFNSLTREKEVFVPQQGKKVKDISFDPTNLHSVHLAGHLVQLWPHSLWCFTHGSCKKLSLFWHSPESSSGGKKYKVTPCNCWDKWWSSFSILIHAGLFWLRRLFCDEHHWHRR